MSASLPLVRALPAAPESRGPAWLTPLRAEAWRRFGASGLPTAGDEEWRFTELGAIRDTAFRPQSVLVTRGEVTPARLGARVRLVSADASAMLVNGVVRSCMGSGLQLVSLTDALARDGENLRPLLDDASGARWFAALNTALFTDGVWVHVPIGLASAPLVVVHHRAEPCEGPTVCYPRVLVKIDAGAKATLVEIYETGAGERTLTNAWTRVHVGAGAVVEHVRVHAGGTAGSVIAWLGAEVGRDATYRSRVVSVGGLLTRCDLDAVMTGEGARVDLVGIYHADTGEQVDHHTVVEHRVPNGTTREVYRGIVQGSGRAVFDGRIVVCPGARGAQASEENKNLLLSRDGVVHTKPHLEIGNDDVRCGHGATVGALDAEELFYLRSRGIGGDEAQALLTSAFVRPLLAEIALPAVRSVCSELLSERIGELAAGEEAGP